MKKNTKYALLALVALLIVAAVVFIVVSNANKKNVTEETTPAVTAEATPELTGEATSEPAQAADADPVLVTVNGEEIRESSQDFQVWKNYILSQVGADPDEETLKMVDQYALQYTVSYAVMKQNLDKMGLGVTAEEAEAERTAAKQQWDGIVDNMMAQMYGIGEDASEEDKTAGRADTLAYIQTNYGYTEETFIAESALNQVYTKAQELASQGVEVTDEEVETYFNELVAEDRDMLMSYVTSDDGQTDGTLSEEEINNELVQLYEMYQQYFGQEFYYVPDGYRGITHILLDVDEELLNNWKDLQARLEEQADTEAEATDTTETETTDTTDADAETTAAPAEEPVTPEMVEAAKQAILDSVKDTVDEINGKLANGASFDDLIVEYGKDPGMESEETRKKGYPVHAASLVYDQNFTNGAMTLEKVGDVSDPVVSSFGVHILYYLRDIPGGSVEYTDELKETLRGEKLNEKINDVFSDMMDKWEGESEIIWTEAGESWKIPEAETAEETAEADE